MFEHENVLYKERRSEVSNQYLRGVRVLITGVGFKPINHIFTDITKDLRSHTSIWLEKGRTGEYKANIGTACAVECAHQGAALHLVARTKEKLRIVKNWIKFVAGGDPRGYFLFGFNEL